MKRVFALLLLTISFIAYAQNGDGWRVVSKSGQGVFFVAISKDRVTDKSVYQNAINGLCKSINFCQVLYWREGDVKPTTRFPLTRREEMSQISAYIQNKSTGLKSQTWRCGAVPNTDQTSCFED